DRNVTGVQTCALPICNHSLVFELYRPTEGTIYIDQKPMSDYPLKRIRDSIGYVPQNPLLFTGTITDNIAWGKQDAIQEDIIKAEIGRASCRERKGVRE